MAESTNILQDRYKLLEKIGMGGTAIVWKAEDLRLGNLCAVKSYAPAHNNPDLREYLEQFSEEAKILGQMSHPSIVKVRDTFTDTDGIPYCVMDLVTGESLEDIIESSKFGLPIASAIDFAIQLCDVLDYMHNFVDGQGKRRPVIHKDLKPENIKVLKNGWDEQKPDSTQKIVLMDFGIAKIEAPNKGTSLIMGTAGYASPEQIKGETTYRSDLYSLGALIYKMATNKKIDNFIFKKLETLPKEYEKLNDILEILLQLDPAKRQYDAKMLKQELEGLNKTVQNSAIKISENQGIQDIIASYKEIPEYCDSETKMMSWLMDTIDPKTVNPARIRSFFENYFKIYNDYNKITTRLFVRCLLSLAIYKGHKEFDFDTTGLSETRSSVSNIHGIASGPKISFNITGSVPERGFANSKYLNVIFAGEAKKCFGAGSMHSAFTLIGCVDGEYFLAGSQWNTIILECSIKNYLIYSCNSYSCKFSKECNEGQRPKSSVFKSSDAVTLKTCFESFGEKKYNNRFFLLDKDGADETEVFASAPEFKPTAHTKTAKWYEFWK